ncbi:putative ubiquinol-cytochrome C reductase complex, subunit X [Elsinoe ampelina]|uniref:Complex III subunit 9 n=1 Tax=Elsinoe ampelina TaxID=302913 RepID=A0A6A6GPX0_9PEZI|nr:putative ubiquinol-cytochrome C reductase complex, subunit X [Elsinoe ampelina]
MSSVFGTLYNTLIKRNTIFLGTVFASAFALEIVFDTTSNKIWDAVNRGRQWKDIKYRYLQKAEDEDDDE